MTIYNKTGSGRVVKIKKLFLQNLQLAAATGVAIRFDLFKVTAVPTGGTNITMESADSNDAVPAQTAIGVTTGSTVTNSSRLFAYATTNDEIGATNAFPTSVLQAVSNLMPEGSEIKEITLREGQGITLQQITSSAVGLYGFLAVVTIE